MKILAALLAFGAFAFSPTLANAAANNPGVKYGEAGYWEVFKNLRNDASSRCDIYVGTRDHDVFMAFAPIGDILIFGFSIKDGANFKAGTRGDLRATFVADSKVEDVIEFEASAEVNDDAGGNGRTFYGKIPAAEKFLDTFSRSEVMGIFTQGSSRRLALINLDGSGEAIELLRRCAYSIPAN
ncbi:MAG: hypothetical protein B7X90_16990 [Novosphingobium sp. 17-62-19]|uniref:hypothetical protein n=1 Tax=Novosphingobium sp. 17-62-19 TaxID=1970406 RepID=UPI000BCBAC7F|nr:hypothetical protein [Novosphingobium sp. 17-62-19]OZA16847.1 MAG: hypothetical protein B7X90_16990 [Novosphingobium sp. 17-62-19]